MRADEDRNTASRPSADGLWREISGEMFADPEDAPAAFAKYLEMYEMAGQLARDRPGDPDPVRLVAHCGAVLVTLACEVDELDLARRVFGELRTGDRPVREDPEIRECEALAGRSLVFAQGDAGDVAAAYGTYREMMALSTAFPDDDVVAAAVAEAAAGLATDYGCTGDHDRLALILADLSVIAARHPGQPLFAHLLGRGALCQLEALLRAGDRTGAARVARVYSAILSSAAFRAHMRETFGADAEAPLAEVADLLGG